MAVIPARLDSTRLPRKVLMPIGDKSLIHRVYEAVSTTNLFDEVVIAVDSEEVEAHVRAFGARVQMTSVLHQSGTDRCAEVASKFTDFNYIINVQGDEPFISRDTLKSLIDVLLVQKAKIASLMTLIKTVDELKDESVVKVVVNRQGEALYFSRAAIPFPRGSEFQYFIKNEIYYRHLGVYGFQAQILQEICNLSPGRYESIEKLEQLRWLEEGYKIHMGQIYEAGIGIDTLEDLERARKMV